ncbi:hypothetical protein TEQG_08169 [Trichophyton equinum CBS 127.97]|uniref:Uncharacterized protein n=1 Tax=Trichophyton equinum (strain ATCC MYA-4606 / CBS 127.97) TaxID=559882 RepID=F2Q502_TRIEC|nr:hypothetical protein TEQG_08169 [Trichophyton equinum CBS 127.97]
MGGKCLIYGVRSLRFFGLTFWSGRSFAGHGMLRGGLRLETPYERRDYEKLRRDIFTDGRDIKRSRLRDTKSDGKPMRKNKPSQQEEEMRETPPWMISLGWRRLPAAGEAGAVQSSLNSPARGGRTREAGPPGASGRPTSTASGLSEPETFEASPSNKCSVEEQALYIVHW